MIISYLGLASVTGIVVCLFALRKYRESKWGVCKSTRRLDGKVVVITGANSGIGRETAREVARRGAVVVLACRNRDYGISAIENIRKSTKYGNFIVVDLDLGDLASVKRCARYLLDKFPQIDILINNAGVVHPPLPQLQTKDGFEIHFGVNHLGHFLFTQLLFDRIKETPNSRIVIVSSKLCENGNIDLNVISKCQDNMTRKGRNVLYSDSKLCNLLHAQELSRRLVGTNTGVYVLCPGFVHTELFRHTVKQTSWIGLFAFLPIAFLFMRSAKQGAECSVYCSVSEELSGTDFGFYRDCKPFTPNVKAQNIENTTTAAQLWDYSIQLVKPFL